MTYAITALCTVISLFIGIVSYIVIDLRTKKADKSQISDVPSESSSEGETLDIAQNAPEKKGIIQRLREFFRSLTLKKWIVLATSAALTGITCFAVQSYGLETVETVKVIVCTQLLMAASMIDFFIKIIPNKLTLTMLVFGVMFLIAEFAFMRDNFQELFLAALIGLIASFVILLIMSLATKGGLGMGDVKLISAVGFLIGIAGVFYSLTYGLLLCLAVSLTLLAMRKKTLKDFLPFGPFFFIGFVISIVIGTF